MKNLDNKTLEFDEKTISETFKEGGSIIASNPYGNYEPRAI